MPDFDPQSGSAAPAPDWLVRLAAGVETSVPASLCSLIWFGWHSRLIGEPWWSKFNVAAAPFLGNCVFYSGLGWATVAGAALLVLVYSLVGIVFAFLAGGGGAARGLLRAALWMACWHIFSQRYFWPLLDPDAPSYFPISATLPAHAATAILLARLAPAYRRLRALSPDRGDVAKGAAVLGAGFPCAADTGSGQQAPADGEDPSRPLSPDC
jgi:hypothetical protein